MTAVTRTFEVKSDPSTVITYLKDFAHAEQWDPGTETCTRTDSGPVAVGATWHNVSKVAGVTTELTYTLQQLTEDTIVLVGKNDTATSTDTITIRANDSGGSQVTYHADIDMHGAAKLASPAVKLLFEKLGNDTEKQMSEVLNRLN